MGSITLLECGRVLVTSDYSLYVLDCLHCKKILTQWETFSEHIKQCKKFRNKQKSGGRANEDTSMYLRTEDSAAEKRTADEQEGELEKVSNDEVAENMRKQIEHLHANCYDEGDEPTEEQEIVAAWPIEIIKQEDIKKDPEIPWHMEDENKHMEGSEQHEDLDDEEFVNDVGNISENSEQHDVEDNSSQIDEMIDDIDEKDFNCEFDDIDEDMGDNAESNAFIDTDDDIDDENSTNEADFEEYHNSEDKECESSVAEQSDDVCSEDIDINDEKGITLSKSTDKKYNQHDIPSNTIDRKKDTEKQRFILSFALTPVNVIKKFIAQVKAHPCLWRGNTTAYRNRKPRNMALSAISDVLHITFNSVAKSVQYLLRWYAIEYQKCKGNTTASAEPNDTLNKYYVMCSFLNERMEQTIAENERIKQQRAARHKTICQHCGKSVETLRIVAHTRRHTKNFDFMCDICQKLCQNASDLRTHMRVHTGERPYECSTCGKSYKTSSALCGHKRMHEKPAFQCTLCPKTFHKGYMLKNHMNIHLNRRPFQCEHCLKSFTSPRYLYMHTKPVLRCAKIKKGQKTSS